MLKTIKTTKHMKLDELIKYVWENNIKNKTYYSIKESSLGIVEGDLKKIRKEIKVYDGRLQTYDYMDADDLFPVEIEKEITEDTEFELLVGVYFYDDVGRYNVSTFYNKSIDDVKDSEALYIYALINEKLELIWERDKHASN